jgi:transposase
MEDDMRQGIETTITEAERPVLEALTRSRDRREADRARAILWSARAGDGHEIAQAFGVRPNQVYQWRMRCRAGGAVALRSRPYQGRAPVKSTVLLAEAKALLRETAAGAWTLTRLRREIEARAGMTVTTKYCEGVLRREGLWPEAVPRGATVEAWPR